MTIDIFRLQRRLTEAGFSPGAVDGRLGPRTYARLFSFVAGRELGGIGRDLGVGANMHLRSYDITTGRRLAHFLGQTAHESGRFRHFVEIWGPSPTQQRYEGRRALGNVRPGDGRRYLGRGIIQLTGRANYRDAGARLGLPLEASPELAARPDIAVLVAADYWRSRNINDAADDDDLEQVTWLINGGTNGIEDRRELTARARRVLL